MNTLEEKRILAKQCLFEAELNLTKKREELSRRANILRLLLDIVNENKSIQCFKLNKGWTKEQIIDNKKNRAFKRTIAEFHYDRLSNEYKNEMDAFKEAEREVRICIYNIAELF